MIRIVILISFFVTIISSAVTEINGVTYTIGPNQTYLNADFSMLILVELIFPGLHLQIVILIMLVLMGHH